MKSILIIGSNGLLGQTLTNRLMHSSFNLFALGRGYNRNKIIKSDKYYDVDITDKESLLYVINKIKPNYIINAAAITNVDYCETHKNECDAVNFEAVKTMITGARQNNSHIIHISTDFVFDGIKGNYKETDIACPLNYYGESKLKSESLLKNNNIPYTILRTILVFGYQPNLKQKNILLWLLAKLQNNEKLTMVDDQIRTPTYVKDLAEACILSIKKNAVGLYHISGIDLLNMFELANIVANVFNLNPKLISAIPTSRLKQVAVRPKITGFNIEKAKKDLDFKPLAFKHALLEVKNKLG